jgi:hypothetical protein
MVCVIFILQPSFVLYCKRLLYVYMKRKCPTNDRKHVMPFLKMSWYKVSHLVKALPENQVHGMGKENVNASTITARNRLFRISVMSCACLLMNTAATASVSVVLDDWSASSDLWLRCIVFEEAMTRNWAAYGMHEGSRFICFSSVRDDIF